MNTRTTLTVAILVLLAAVGAVQLADPQLGDRTPPEIDYSEPPAEIAADAATQFEYVDYAYRLDIADNRSGPWKQVRTMRIDHHDREYWKEGPIGKEGVTIYSNDAISFVRPGSESPWRVSPVSETVYPARSITQPFSSDAISGSSGSVITENDSTLVVRINSNPLKIISRFSGRSTVFIDRSSGLILAAVVEYEVGQKRSRFLRFRLTGSNTSVTRPAKIQLSPRELLWDFFRGPLFRL